MIRVLVSGCLLGDRVRYNGGDSAASSGILERWRSEGRIVQFCPEVGGGLGVPRPSAEIAGTRVLTQAGRDVTEAFEAGAQLALEVARANAAPLAILKEGSPSCGSHRINDGTFSGRKIEGRGVTAALLERHGIRVFSEEEVDAAAEYLRELEGRV